jgi:hypothetical protein
LKLLRKKSDFVLDFLKGMRVPVNTGFQALLLKDFAKVLFAAIQN